MSTPVSSSPIISTRPLLHVTVALLEFADLPASDLGPEYLEHFFYCGVTEAPAGLIGLEMYGADALLRGIA